MSRRDYLEGYFLQHPFEITSPPTSDYNCIAWAVGEDHRWWDTSDHGHWPPDVERSPRPVCLIEALRTVGFEPCDGEDHEPDFDRIALFERDGAWTHACRVGENGVWWSKLGRQEDVRHDRAGGEQCYGRLFAFMKRKRPKREAR